MTTRLAKFRRAMGWSQEALAAELTVSVSTISRWERTADPVGCNPFVSILRAAVTRSSHRLALYAHAMLPSGYLEEIRRSTTERTVYAGPEAVVVEMSEAVRQNWGMMRYCSGISVAPLLPTSHREMIAKYHAEIGEIVESADSSREMVFVTHGGPPGLVWPWRQHIQHAPFPHIIEMNSVPISQEQYEATEPRFYIRSR